MWQLELFIFVKFPFPLRDFNIRNQAWIQLAYSHAVMHLYCLNIPAPPVRPIILNGPFREWKLLVLFYKLPDSRQAVTLDFKGLIKEGDTELQCGGRPLSVFCVTLLGTKPQRLFFFFSIFFIMVISKHSSIIWTRAALLTKFRLTSVGERSSWFYPQYHMFYVNQEIMGDWDQDMLSSSAQRISSFIGSRLLTKFIKCFTPVFIKELINWSNVSFSL